MHPCTGVTCWDDGGWRTGVSERVSAAQAAGGWWWWWWKSKIRRKDCGRGRGCGWRWSHGTLHTAVYRPQPLRWDRVHQQRCHHRSSSQGQSSLLHCFSCRSLGQVACCFEAPLPRSLPTQACNHKRARNKQQQASKHPANQTTASQPHTQSITSEQLVNGNELTDIVTVNERIDAIRCSTPE